MNSSILSLLLWFWTLSRVLSREAQGGGTQSPLEWHRWCRTDSLFTTLVSSIRPQTLHNRRKRWSILLLNKCKRSWRITITDSSIIVLPWCDVGHMLHCNSIWTCCKYRVCWSLVQHLRFSCRRFGAKVREGRLTRMNAHENAIKLSMNRWVTCSRTRTSYYYEWWHATSNLNGV